MTRDRWHAVTSVRGWLAAGAFAGVMALGSGPLSAAVAPPAGVEASGLSRDGLVQDVRARGGGGGGLRSGGGGHFRGGGSHFRGGGSHFRGGYRPYRYAPLLLAPPLLYGGYSYYYDDDCRTVRVRERRCWIDGDGDRRCGHRWVLRRICD